MHSVISNDSISISIYLAFAGFGVFFVLVQNQNSSAWLNWYDNDRNGNNIYMDRQRKKYQIWCDTYSISNKTNQDKIHIILLII